MFQFHSQMFYKRSRKSWFEQVCTSFVLVIVVFNLIACTFCETGEKRLKIKLMLTMWFIHSSVFSGSIVGVHPGRDGNWSPQEQTAEGDDRLTWALHNYHNSSCCLSQSKTVCVGTYHRVKHVQQLQTMQILSHVSTCTIICPPPPPTGIFRILPFFL